RFLVGEVEGGQGDRRRPAAQPQAQGLAYFDLATLADDRLAGTAEQAAWPEPALGGLGQLGGAAAVVRRVEEQGQVRGAPQRPPGAAADLVEGLPGVGGGGEGGGERHGSSPWSRPATPG